MQLWEITYQAVLAQKLQQDTFIDPDGHPCPKGGFGHALQSAEFAKKVADKMCKNHPDHNSHTHVHTHTTRTQEA